MYIPRQTQRRVKGRVRDRVKVGVSKTRQPKDHASHSIDQTIEPALTLLPSGLFFCIQSTRCEQLEEKRTI